MVMLAHADLPKDCPITVVAHPSSKIKKHDTVYQYS